MDTTLALVLECYEKVIPHSWRDSLQLPKIQAYSNLDRKCKTIFLEFFL
jgi:hypothetical protein